LFVNIVGIIEDSHYHLVRMEDKGGNMEEKPTALNFTTCPICGSERLQANEVLQKEIEKGRMPKNSKAFLFTHQSIIAAGQNWLSAPMVMSFYDVCMDCGTVVCIHAEVRTAVAGGKMPQAGTQFSTS